MVHRTPFILPLLYPQLVWRIPTIEKQLFLTFDDGPITGPTEYVLEQLSLYGAKATFFCIGDNIQKHPDVFRAVVDGGHAVGNHTHNHLNGWKTDTDQYLINIDKCSTVIEEQAPASSRWLFRPPYGRITRKQIQQLSAFKIVMWDVLTVDYNLRLSAERCLRNSIGATRNGSIVVFHDSIKAERNLKYTLPRYIEHFASAGYQFNVIPT